MDGLYAHWRDHCHCDSGVDHDGAEGYIVYTMDAVTHTILAVITVGIAYLTGGWMKHRETRARMMELMQEQWQPSKREREWMARVRRDTVTNAPDQLELFTIESISKLNTR